MCEAAPVSVSNQKERPLSMFGTLPSVANERDTSTLKVNVPTLEVHLVLLPLPSTLLSLNDNRALLMAAEADVMVIAEMTARVRLSIVFFM